MFIGPCIFVLTEELKNQLDATYYFIVFLKGSTFFGHYYAHHQELLAFNTTEKLNVFSAHAMKA